MAALQQEEARGVDADVVERSSRVTNSPARFDIWSALAALEQVDQLHDQQLERAGLAAQRLPGGRMRAT